MILSTIILGILPYLSSGVIDTTNVETLGLTMTEGTKTVTIFSPNDETHHYANGVVMTAFKDVLYCMWQSSQTDEDAPETCVMYSKSSDEGVTWTKPEKLAASTSGQRVCSPSAATPIIYIVGMARHGASLNLSGWQTGG